MLIPSHTEYGIPFDASLSRRVNANSQQHPEAAIIIHKLIKKGEC